MKPSWRSRRNAAARGALTTAVRSVLPLLERFTIAVSTLSNVAALTEQRGDDAYTDVMLAFERELTTASNAILTLLSEIASALGPEPVTHSKTNEQLRHDGWVYLVQNLRNGDLKIGHSRNVPERVRNIQRGVAGRVRLVDSFPGSLADEARAKQMFRTLRIHGEWFAPAPDIFEWYVHRRMMLAIGAEAAFRSFSSVSVVEWDESDSIETVADELVVVIGAEVVGELSSASVEDVRDWAGAKRFPTLEQEETLRVAQHLVRVLLRRLVPGDIRLWFTRASEGLDNKKPVEVIAAGTQRAQRMDLVDAALSDSRRWLRDRLA